MNIVILFLRIVVSAVLAVAGFAKLADPKGSEDAFHGFGVPGWLAKPLVPLLPLAEIAIAIALLPVDFAIWGAWGALGLFLVFILGMLVAMAKGQAPDCHCFGQLHSEPVSSKTVVRNLLLAGCCGAIVWMGPGESPFAWLGSLSVAEVAMLVIVLGVLTITLTQTWVLFQMMRQNGRILSRLDELEAAGTKKEPAAPPPPAGLPVGNDAPLFSLPTAAGPKAGLDNLLESGKPVLLAFTDPNCGPCSALLPDLAKWDAEFAGNFNLALISRGTTEANLAKLGKPGFRNVLLQNANEIGDAYQAQATPSAVLIGADGRIGSPVAVGPDAIRALVARTVNRSFEGVQVKVNDPAPTFVLPDVKGGLVSSSAFQGSATLFVFWNPTCGFCSNMLPDIKKWESRRTKEDPQMVLIAAGDAVSNSKYGIRSRVLLDDSSAVSKMFNANGTPTGVLLDQDGYLVSPEVAIGAVKVFELADSWRNRKSELLTGK